VKEKLIAMVAERANITPEAANRAVDTVLGYLRENPDAVKELVGKAAGSGLLGSLGARFRR
jgi:hypothetical protein